MKILHKLDHVRRPRQPILLAAGFFDGMHRGHQNVIRRTVAAARQGMGTAWVMTFDTLPMKVLHPGSAPRLLTSTAHKLRLLEALGVEGCVVIPFTPRYAQQEPEAFIAMLIRSAPTLACIVVGQNWTFGREGRGNAALLKTLAAHYGFKVITIPPLRWRDKPISSTRIRYAVAAGRLVDAAHMLGRPFSILGTVIPGQKIGRTLGIPTANLDPHNEVRPPSGVYAVVAIMGGKRHLGVVNMGKRPTVKAQDHSEPTLELHLFDLRRNLYGKDIEVFFLKKLRNEKHFASLKALKLQVQQDIQEARRWLARPRRGGKRQ